MAIYRLQIRYFYDTECPCFSAGSKVKMSSIFSRTFENYVNVGKMHGNQS